MRQSSESLAGQIGYINLSPFNSPELEYKNLRNHWFKGGFPLSYLSSDISLSSSWCENFIRFFLEKGQLWIAVEFKISMGTEVLLWEKLEQKAHV